MVLVVLSAVEWVYSEILCQEKLGQMVVSVEMDFQVELVAYWASLRINQVSLEACLASLRVG